MLILVAAALVSTTTFVVNTTDNIDEDTADACTVAHPHCSFAEAVRLSTDVDDDVEIQVLPGGGGVISFGGLNLSRTGVSGNLTIDGTGALGFAVGTPSVELNGPLGLSHTGSSAVIAVRGFAFTGQLNLGESGSSLSYDISDCTFGRGLDGLAVPGFIGINVSGGGGVADLALTRVDIISQVAFGAELSDLRDVSFVDVNLGVSGDLVAGNNIGIRTLGITGSLTWDGGVIVDSIDRSFLIQGGPTTAAFSNFTVGALADGTPAPNQGTGLPLSGIDLSTLTNVTVVNSADVGLSGAFTASSNVFVGVLPDGTPGPNLGGGVDGSITCNGCVIAHNGGGGAGTLAGNGNNVHDNGAGVGNLNGDDNLIHDNLGFGAVTVTGNGNNISDNGGNGVDGAVTGDDNVISGNGGRGVGALNGNDNLVTDNLTGASSVAGQRNTVTLNHGIGVNGGITGNDHRVSDNEGDGIHGAVSCSGCVIEDNRGHGVVGDAGTGCTGCDLLANDGDGLRSDTSSQILCSGCEIADNGGDGIRGVRGDAVGVDCDVHDNANGLHGDGAPALCTNCQVHDNTDDGVRIEVGGAATCTTCTIVDNGGGIGGAGGGLALASSFVGAHADGSTGPNGNGPQIELTNTDATVSGSRVRGSGAGAVINVDGGSFQADLESRFDNGDIAVQADDSSVSSFATVCDVGTGYVASGGSLTIGGRVANEEGCDSRVLAVGVDASCDVSADNLVVEAALSALSIHDVDIVNVALFEISLLAPAALSIQRGASGGSVQMTGQAEGRVVIDDVVLDELRAGSARRSSLKTNAEPQRVLAAADDPAGNDVQIAPFLVRDAVGTGFRVGNARVGVSSLAVSAESCSGRGIDLDIQSSAGGSGLGALEAKPNEAVMVLTPSSNGSDGAVVVISVDSLSLNGAATGNVGSGFILDVSPGAGGGALSLGEIVVALDGKDVLRTNDASENAEETLLGLSAVDNGGDGLRILGSSAGALRAFSSFGNGGDGLQIGGSIGLDVAAADVGDVLDVNLGATAPNNGAGIVAEDDATVALGLDRRLRRAELTTQPARVGHNDGGGVLVRGNALVDVAPGFAAFDVPFGIDYDDDGRTANDIGDEDHALNAPFIARVDRAGADFVVHGFAPTLANVMFFIADRSEGDAAPFAFLGEASEGSIGDTDPGTGDYDDDQRGSDRDAAAFSFRFSSARGAVQLPLGAVPLVAIASVRGRASEPSTSFFLDACSRSDEDPDCDFDRDGLTNAEEAAIGTSHLNADTDGDDLSDRAEGSADSDDDGIIDALESNQRDLDRDELPEQRDADDLDPCVPSTASPRCDDDGDGLSSADELVFGTDPTKADSDGDGLPDGIEARSDTDDDGISDALESLSFDGDGDGVSDQFDREVVPFACIGLPTLRGVVTIDDDADLAALQGTGCIVGSLVLRGGDRAGPLALPALRVVTGAIVCEGTPLTELQLPLLGQAGLVAISDNAGLVAVQLPLLGLVRGDVVIAGNPSLSSVVVDGALGNIQGDLVIDDCDALTSVSLPKVQSVGGDLIIDDCDALTSVTMPRLQSVGGTVIVEGADGAVVCLREGCDFDGDSVPDALELARGTNPRDIDSDGDGRSDGVEGDADLDHDGTIDGLENDDDDDDDDGVPAPRDANDDDACVPDVTLSACDHDDDGVADSIEIARGTNPLAPDSDGDGKGDALEGDDDSDGDGDLDARERDDVDFDGDGRSAERDEDDGDACSPDPDGGACDSDDDGVSDREEVDQGTAPTASDTDQDGVPDGAERGDSDGDGIVDALESASGDADDDGTSDQGDRADNDPCAPNPLASACLDARAPAAPPRACAALETAGGDVVLLDDDDVAAFLANGIQCIAGNLVVGGGVTNLDLGGLVIVTGDVIVRDADALTSIAFPDLSSAGSFDVEANDALLSFQAPLLGSVDGDLVFANCDALPELTLPALASIDGDVRVADNDALGNISLEALVDVDGDVDLAANGDVDLSSLENVGGDLAVMTPEGSVDISALEDVGGELVIDANAVAAPAGQNCGTNGCTTVCGDSVAAGLEECDDGNSDDGDGCSTSCTIEPGFICTDDGCFDLDQQLEGVAGTCAALATRDSAAFGLLLLGLWARRRSPGRAGRSSRGHPRGQPTG